MCVSSLSHVFLALGNIPYPGSLPFLLAKVETDWLTTYTYMRHACGGTMSLVYKIRQLTLYIKQGSCLKLFYTSEVNHLNITKCIKKFRHRINAIRFIYKNLSQAFLVCWPLPPPLHRLTSIFPFSIWTRLLSQSSYWWCVKSHRFKGFRSWGNKEVK